MAGSLTVTTFVTLDGVMQAPGGPEEDPSGGFKHGGWMVPYFDEDLGPIVDDYFGKADAFLLGRKTYEIFAAYWPRITDPNNAIATGLNRLPKYVASKTLSKADWKETTIVRDVVKQIPDLKRKYDREVQVHGSAGLIQTLVANDLVDVYRLWTFPILLGTGKRLFDPGAVPTGLSLVDSRKTSTGVVYNVYRRAGKPTYGTFALDS